MGVQVDAFAGLLSHKHKASEVKVADLVGYFTGEDNETVLAEIGAILATLTNPLLFKGAIAVAADFPTNAAVQTGWFYKITANVTDNDAAKTNTGASFLVDDEIAWDGTAWIEIGNASLPWGSITGTLADQTDLQSALDAKLAIGANVSQLVNDAGYITGIAWGDVTGTLADQTDLQAALDAKPDTLAEVLVGGNNTGANDIEIASGQQLKSEAGALLALKSYNTSAGSAPATDTHGIVSYWTLDGNANDSVGTNNGTLVNAPSYVTGVFGDALDFNGTTQYVSVPDDASLDFGTGNFSVNFWVKMNPAATAVEYLIGKDSTTAGWYLKVYRLAASYVYLWTHSGGTASYKDARVTSGDYLYDGNWHMLTIVKAGAAATDLYIYVDGIDRTSATHAASGGNPNVDNSSTLRYGGSLDGSTSKYSDSTIDNVTIYNEVLTPSEILDFYNASLAGSSVYHTIDTDETAVAGSKLVSIRNAGVEKSFLDENGDFNGGLNATRYVRMPIEIVTASTDTLDDTNYTVLCDATSNAITITLPSVADYEKVIYCIKKIDSTGNAITITSADGIDGATNQYLYTQYEALTIQASATGYHIL